MSVPENSKVEDLPDGASDGDPVSTLRGAGVRVDAARAGRVAVACGLAAVVVMAIVLLVAGVRKNAQIEELQAHGAPVVMTITDSHALLGGSGSNAAGYSSGGTYRFRGRVYSASVPDQVPRVLGAKVHGIVSTTDPGLFSLPRVVASEHASDAVYIVPAMLIAVAAGIGGWLLIRRRRRSAA